MVSTSSRYSINPCKMLKDDNLLKVKSVDNVNLHNQKWVSAMALGRFVALQFGSVEVEFR